MKKTNLPVFLIIFLCVGVFGFLCFTKISQSAETIYTDGFESAFGNWVNVLGDNFNWTRRSGSTPSIGTGPSSAHTGSYYVYTESSSPNYPNRTAILEGPTFTFTSGSIAFWYHMYGLSMGSLYLQISSPPYISWTTIWSKSGNQGNSWYSANVDLASYAGDSKRLRFRGVTGLSWTSDMALDDITLTYNDGVGSSSCIGTNTERKDCCTCLGITASPDSINPGDSSTLTLYIDNNPDAASSVCSPDGFSVDDGTAVCSINNGVLSDTTFNDGSYNYLVSPSNTVTYIATCDGIGGTESTSVTITVISNQSPTATNLTVSALDYCTYSLPTSFSWDFSDPNIGDVQEYYQVQIDNNALFSSIEIDSGKIHSPSESYMASGFLYNTTYYWRLKVWDDKGADSGWIYGLSFTTPLHKYPDPDFTWSPSSPSIGEIAQLCAVQTGVCATNQSICYNSSNNPISCSGKTFLWILPPEAEFATTSTASTENPQIKFTDSGNYIVTLKITDDVGFCSQSHQIQATLPLPEWEETTP